MIICVSDVVSHMLVGTMAISTERDRTRSTNLVQDPWLTNVSKFKLCATGMQLSDQQISIITRNHDFSLVVSCRHVYFCQKKRRRSPLLSLQSLIRKPETPLMPIDLLPALVVSFQNSTKRL